MTFWKNAFKNCFVFAGCLLIQNPAAAQQTDAPDVMSMNEHFRSAYATEKQDILAHVGPAIVLTADKLVLLNSGKRQEASFVPAEYTLYKTIDHIPLMIFVSLRDHTDRPLDDAKITELKSFIPLMAKTTQALAHYRLPPDTVARQKVIMDGSLAFLKKAISSGTVSNKELQAFTAGLRPAILGNVNDAVALELASLDKKVEVWRKELPADQWNSVHVIIAGSHMPRQQSHFMQYFSALLKQKEEGRKLIYMEGVDDEQHALDLLATHLLDESIGSAFFGDSWRLHRDLLADGAKLYLAKHPPK